MGLPGDGTVQIAEYLKNYRNSKAAQFENVKFSKNRKYVNLVEIVQIATPDAGTKTSEISLHFQEFYIVFKV